MTKPSSDPESSKATTSAVRNQAWLKEAVTSSEATLPGQIGKLMNYYVKGFYATHLIDVGAKLGLFRCLETASGGLTSGQIAERSGYYPKYVALWCEAACALEMLDYDPGTGYRLAPFMDEILGRPGGTFYLGSAPNFHLQMAQDFAYYPELFRTGGVRPYQEHSEEFFRNVAAATAALPRMFVDAVLPQLPELKARLETGGDILDVGCGGGHALVEVADRYPNVRCVGVDVEPYSVSLAHELIRSRGLSDRVEVRHVDGAAWPEDLADSFDVVMSFLVLHEIRPESKAEVLGQCARVLRPRGQFLLFDEHYPSRPSELRDPLLIHSVVSQWYEMAMGNIVNTKEEIHSLLRQQGMRVRGETSFARFYVLLAEKRP